MVLYFPVFLINISTIVYHFIMVTNSVPCNQTNADAGNIFIPEYTAVYTCLLCETSQQSREVKVVHVEGPIEVTSGNLRNQDILVMDSSITVTVEGGVKALPHVYDGFFPPTGQVTISGEIAFQLDTDPATDPPVFTLTCTSTGGPATTVSWRRDGTMLNDDNTYSITSQVSNGTTATYTHTLTVTGRLVGEYQCTVSNIRTPSGSSRSLTVGKVPET